MKLVFLQACAADLLWMRRYYRAVFPDGSARAKKAYAQTKTLIKANPHIGEAVDGFEGVYEFPVLRTPFSFIYRIVGDRIEILRIVDGRSDWGG